MGSSDQATCRSTYEVPSLAEEYSTKSQSSSLQGSPLSPPLGTECNLSNDEQSRILQALQDDAESAESDATHPSGQDQRPGEYLYGIKRWLEELWRDSPEKLVPATTLLADASREPKWRASFGRCGVLEFYLGVVATPTVDDRILLHALRLIGNSCADTDENRQRVVENNNFPPIFNLISNPAVSHVAIPVIYNICADFEPAQAQVASDGVVYTLLRMLGDGSIKENALVANVCELVEITREQVLAKDASPDDALQLILGLVDCPDIEPTNFIALTNFLLSHLQSARFQQLCVTQMIVGDALSALQRSYHFDSALFTTDEEASLVQFRLGINQVLSDISALPTFSSKYPLTSPLVNTLLSWLRETEEDQLQTCACVMLGNIAREDTICESMVRDYEIHLPLVSILNNVAKGGVLHAAVGFLKNLAVAGNNREYLGEAGVIKAVSRLWSLESVPQVQFMAVSLTRQVIGSSVSNIAHLLAPLPSGCGQPVDSRTHLSLLLDLFAKTDSPPIRMEIGRTVAAICRALLRLGDDGSVSDDTKPLLTSLFGSHERLSRPVGAMIMQSEWPVVQSEGWFALALMVSTVAGSIAAVDCIENMDVSPALSDVIHASVSVPPTGASTEETTVQSKNARDRDNAMILAHGILKHNPHNLSQARRDVLENLMRGDSREASNQT